MGLNQVPGKRFPLIVGHGEARVQLQTQCTKTPMQQEVARERERDVGKYPELTMGIMHASAATRD